MMQMKLLLALSTWLPRVVQRRKDGSAMFQNASTPVSICFHNSVLSRPWTLQQGARL